jgi:hypothetical protein
MAVAAYPVISPTEQITLEFCCTYLPVLPFEEACVDVEAWVLFPMEMELAQKEYIQHNVSLVLCFC